MVTVVERDASAGLEAFQDRFLAVEAQAFGLTPFQRWSWLAPLWRHAGHGRLLLLEAQNRHGTPLALLPLCLGRYHGLPLRRVTFAGDPLSDYQGPITVAGRELECARAFLEHLVARRGALDLVDLPDVAADSALVGAAKGLSIHAHRVCPTIALPSSFDSYRAARPAHLRGPLDRKRRKLARELGGLVEVTPEGELLPTLERLFELHQARWRARGLGGAFADPGVRAFHRTAVSMLHRADALRLYRLRTREGIGAVFYCLRDDHQVYYYLSGFDLALGRYSPGRLVLMHVIRDAIESGARAVDLLRGDEGYKYDFGAVDRPTLRLVYRPRTPRGLAAAAVNAVERALAIVGGRLRNRLWGGPYRSPSSS